MELCLSDVSSSNSSNSSSRSSSSSANGPSAPVLRDGPGQVAAAEASLMDALRKQRQEQKQKTAVTQPRSVGAFTAVGVSSAEEQLLNALGESISQRQSRADGKQQLRPQSQQPSLPPQLGTPEDELLAATKRRVLGLNSRAQELDEYRSSSMAANQQPHRPLRTRTAEEAVVLQRFGEQQHRIPTPPVHKELLLHQDSKEDKHFRNKMRIFGSVDAMNRVIAGGVATLPKWNPSMVRCDSVGGNSSGQARLATPADPVPTSSLLTAPSSPNGSSPRRKNPEACTTNLRMTFVDLKTLNAQRSQSTDAANASRGTLATPAGEANRPQLPVPTSPSVAPTPKKPPPNHFFLVSRQQLQQLLLNHGAPDSSSGVGPSSPRETAARSGTEPLSTPVVRLPSVSPRKPVMYPLVKGDSRPPTAVGGDDELDGDPYLTEDTAYVVAETRKFEKGTLRAAQLELLKTHEAHCFADDLPAGPGGSRNHTHTSDLLKMIFNSRIALECEVAQQLRGIAEVSGTEKLIQDAIATAQRLAMRSATVDDFHRFLCNILKDPDVSFSETRVIFNAIDSNHSGSIDGAELAEGLRLLLLDESQLILTFGKRVFTEIGRHKDTRLSFLEVQAIMYSALDFCEVEFSDEDITKAMEAAGPRATPRIGSERGGGDKNTNTFLFAAAPNAAVSSSALPALPLSAMSSGAVLSQQMSSSTAAGGAANNNGGLDQFPSFSAGGVDAGVVPSVNLQQHGSLLSNRSTRMVKLNALPSSNTDGATSTAACPTSGVPMSPRSPQNGSDNGQVQFAKFPVVADASQATSVVPLPREKPTLEGLKQRMMNECAIVLRETWKYSQSGQIIVPLLRTLTASIAPLLHAAISAIPTQHFNLKRSGFWKDTLAAEEAKYQQYLALNNLDLDILAKSARRLSFGNNALKARRRGSNVQGGVGILPNNTSPPAARRGSTALSMTAANDLELVRDLHQYSAVLRVTDPPATQRKQSMATGLVSGGSKAQPNAASTARERQRSVVGLLASSPSKRRNDTFTTSTITALVPLSYEVFEEANGEVINVDKLQQQLKDGGLRLSQAQRQMIMQQIEQSRSRAIAATSQQQQQRRGRGGFNNPPPPPSTKPTSTTTRGLVIDEQQASGPPLSSSRDPSISIANSTPGTPNAPSLSKVRSAKFGKSQAAMMDLTEVIDPWHPKFVADVNKINGNPARQLSAPEHNASEFFSRQGLVYVKSSSGIVVPLMADLPSPTV